MMALRSKLCFCVVKLHNASLEPNSGAQVLLTVGFLDVPSDKSYCDSWRIGAREKWGFHPGSRVNRGSWTSQVNNEKGPISSASHQVDKIVDPEWKT